jgi:hypothetical protein
MKKYYYILLLGFVLTACHKEAAVVKNNGGNTLITHKPIDTNAIANTIKFNGAICPVDTVTHTFYLPASTVASVKTYILTYDTSLVKSITINNTAVANNTSTATLTVNTQTKMQVTDVTDKTHSYNLIITGLPMVVMHSGAAVGDGVSTYNSFELIDPDYALHDGEWLINESSTTKIHGASSSTYPKKSLQVSLIDASNDDLDVSLLGLRSDQNWILDAMYIDQARMRNRVCTDIWNTFNNVPYIASEPTALNGTRGYLVEVIENNQYQGVFCLTEKLDRKQIQAKKTYGVMYKSDAALPQTAFDISDTYDDSQGTWDGWEFTYPDLGDTPAPTWKYLADFATFVSTSSDADFASGIGARFNIDNAVDYLIFINAFAIIDNTAKNQYISFYDSRSNTQFFYSPWDMDGSLGRSWDGSLNGTPNLYNDYGGYNNLFSRLMALDASGFKEKVKARWNTLKATQLSKAAFNARVTTYEQQLISTNAGAREMAKWGNVTQDFDTEANYMMSWYSTNYDNVDKMITSW